MDLKASRASSSTVALLLPGDTRAWEQKNNKEKQSNVTASAMRKLSGTLCLFIMSISSGRGRLCRGHLATRVWSMFLSYGLNQNHVGMDKDTAPASHLQRRHTGCAAISTTTLNNGIHIFLLQKAFRLCHVPSLIGIDSSFEGRRGWSIVSQLKTYNCLLSKLAKMISPFIGYLCV